MKLRRARKLVILGVLGSGVALGGGFLVYDAVGDISWVSTAANAAATVAQLQQSYKQAVQMATALKGTSGRWQSGATDWRSMVSPDTWGVNSTWNGSMNTGTNVVASFNKITTQLNSGLNGMPTGFQGAAKLSVAAIERHDGLIQQNATVIGAYQVAQPSYTAKVQQLAIAAVSDDPTQQTYAALAQKNLSATMMQVQAANVGNELTKMQLQNSQAQLLMQREAAVNDVNHATYFYSTVQNSLNSSNDPNALSRVVIP